MSRIQALSAAISLSLVVSCAATPSEEQFSSNQAGLTVPGLFFQGDNFSGAERGFGSELQESWGVALPGEEGKTYTWPLPADHSLPAGMNIVRLPFQWERLQPALNQDFDAGYLAKLHSTVAAWRDKGAVVLLDVHNYAYYKLTGRGTDAKGQLIGSADVPVAAFADLWRRLALEFGSSSPSSPILFGLMNEPHDITVATWVDAAQKALNAIRATGAKNPVFVPGADWTTATDFSWSDNGKLLQSVSDPADNFAIEVHQYYDGACTPTVYADKLKPFEDWAVANHRVAFLGEFDLTDDTAACHEALANFVGHLQARAAGMSDGVWVGYTYWEGMGIASASAELGSHLPTTCTNGSKDGLETAVDCGGTCLRCQNQKACLHDYDCQSGSCVAGACTAAAPAGVGGAAGASSGASGGAGLAMGGAAGVSNNSGGSGGLATAGAADASQAGNDSRAGSVGSSSGGMAGLGAVIATSGNSSSDGATKPGASDAGGCSFGVTSRPTGPGGIASLAALGLFVLRSRRRSAR